MKLIDVFTAFLEKEVNLNPTRLTRLEQSVNAIRDVLAEDDTIGPLFRDVIPAGSWAHGTIIRPVQENDEFDADMLLYLHEQTDWQPKDYLEELWLTFRSHEVYRSKAKRKTRCVRIDYAGDFHVDIVPYVERGGSHYITNRRQPEGVGRFEASDPEAFSAWIDERQRITNDHFIPAVRLLKYLRDFKNTFDCKSIILMTLLGNQVNAIEATYNPTWYADIPSTLVTMLEKLADDLPDTMPAVLDPADTGENFTDRYGDTWNYTNFRFRINNYATRVRAAYDEPDSGLSLKMWQTIFGNSFTSDPDAKKAMADSFSPSLPWGGEEFINRPPYNFSWRLQPQYHTHITGRVIGYVTPWGTQSNGFQQFDLARRGNQVPKQRSLRFTVATNVPKPYTVYWKVRNGGEEAKRLQALRGEISRDEGSLQKTETTSYIGHHYVECYIVKDNVVVSRDRQHVIVPTYH